MSDVKGRAREALNGDGAGGMYDDYDQAIMWACVVRDLLSLVEEQEAEIAGAKVVIAHMSEAMSWVSGHDRTGNDHLDDAMRLADRMDSIRRAYAEYESDLDARKHGGVAADRLVRAVADVIAQEGE